MAAGSKGAQTTTFIFQGGGMQRIALETALVMAVIVLGLEAVHYRSAVLEANVDRKRAWKTVVELREACSEHANVQGRVHSSH